MTSSRWNRLLSDPELLTDATAVAASTRHTLVMAMQMHEHLKLRRRRSDSADLEQAELELGELCEQLSLTLAQTIDKLPKKPHPPTKEIV